MSEDTDKRFDPTPSRIQKARREGNIARSPELITIASFATAAIGVFAVMPMYGSLTRSWIARLAVTPDFPSALAGAMALTAGLPLLAAAVAGTVCSLVQSGGFTFKAPSIKFERLNPQENLKQMFSREAAISIARATLAFVVATAFLVPTANLIFTRVAGTASLQALASLASVGAQRAIESALGVALLFGTADYLIARQRWLKKLRMSFYDLKKEFQENEGDPRLRRKRRARHRALVSGRLKKVKDAAFVVANPTHIAVAIEYQPPQVAVPRVLVMATDEVALEVRTIAKDAGIPIIENVALARTLYATATVGRSIPRETFMGVAEIVSALHKTRRSA